MDLDRYGHKCSIMQTDIDIDTAVEIVADIDTERVTEKGTDVDFALERNIERTN